MKLTHWPLFTAVVLGLSLLPRPVLAAIPSGDLQVHVTDPTNHLWDASSIDELQHLSFDISEESTEISFPAPFIQTGAGKLTGVGVTQMEVASPVFVGTVNAAYKASGKINSVKGVAQLAFTGTAKGPADIGGRISILTGTLAVKVTINSTVQLASGTYTSTGAASGYGSIKEAGGLDFTWTDVVNAMGNGTWVLSMSVTNDAVKKIGGSARATLSSGATFDFTVKGLYKSTTDTSVLVLSATPDSKGSSLKLNLTGSTITSIQGKVSGQTVKWKP